MSAWARSVSWAVTSRVTTHTITPAKPSVIASVTRRILVPSRIFLRRPASSSAGLGQRVHANGERELGQLAGADVDDLAAAGEDRVPRGNAILTGRERRERDALAAAGNPHQRRR